MKEVCGKGERGEEREKRGWAEREVKDEVKQKEEREGEGGGGEGVGRAVERVKAIVGPCPDRLLGLLAGVVLDGPPGGGELRVDEHSRALLRGQARVVLGSWWATAIGARADKWRFGGHSRSCCGL
jgi:hypothetical protein